MIRKLGVSLGVFLLSLTAATPLKAGSLGKLAVITPANVAHLIQIASYERQSNYLLPGQVQVFFNQDSRTLYYNNGDSLLTLRLETGEQDTFPLGPSDVPVAPSFAISPDNQWLVADSSGDFGGVSV